MKRSNVPKPVIVFGVRHQSVSAAARALKCSGGVIRYWLKNQGKVKGRAFYA